VLQLKGVLMEIWTDPGIALIVWFQNVGSWLHTPMELFSFIGDEEFFLMFMPIFFWCISPMLGVRLGLLLLFSATINSIFKLAFYSPRPFWYSREVTAFTAEYSFGMPSGHAMNATSVWGGLALSIRRRWAWIVFPLVILSVGVSRLYMGVHFPVDVLLGWTMGILFLIIYFRLETPVKNWLLRQNAPTQLLTAFGATAVLILSGIIFRAALGAWTIPEAWIANAAFALPDADPINPLALAGIFSNSGVIFGMAAGLIFIYGRGGFQAGGPIWKRVLRFPIGVVGVLLIWQGLGSFLPGGENVVGYSFRYFRYALIGFWVIGAAPMLFVKMRLAEPSLIEPAPAAEEIPAAPTSI
jgi:membrane-associated phospholipid phosphatase